MKLSRTLFAVVAVLLNVAFAGPVSGQTTFDPNSLLFGKPSGNTDRAKEVMQDNEFVAGAAPVGQFLANPLFLDGLPLDYVAFSIESKGELSLIKGDALTGKEMKIPFNIYLRRNGAIIRFPGELGKTHLTIEISPILKAAVPGDQLIVEPTNKEDWQAKRILKVLEGGC